ncbi:MAG: hypothetical protein LC647_12870 [Beggiatoa sp.]|nr:hypothetical protein [Beggiatoa sp.]
MSRRTGMRASPAERGGRKDIPAPPPVSATEPGQRTGTMPNAEALRLAVQLLDNLNAQIRATDEKIRALFAGSAIFVAALTLTGQQALSQLTLIPLIAYAVLLCTLSFSLISAVLALRCQRQDRADEVRVDAARCHRFRRRHRGVAGRTACVLVPLTRKPH